MATAKRIVSQVIGFFPWLVNDFPPSARIMVLVCAGLALFGPTLTPDNTFVFEDMNVLPWTGPFPQTFRPAYWIWAILRLTDPWQYHLLNLGVHALTSVMVGLVGSKLFGWVYLYVPNEPPDRYPVLRSGTNMAWACAAIFWLHPLAVPAVGYATALPEMLVCLGAVTLTWILLQDRTWYWLCAAGVVLAVTLSVKESAIGVLLLPAVTLIVRPIQWKFSSGWVVVGIFLAFLVGVTYGERAFLQEYHAYPWHRWPEEMLPMFSQAATLMSQSAFPFAIAFQLDPEHWETGVANVVVILFSALVFWLIRRERSTAAFAGLYVLALITVRLVIPASNWQDRAPEMWYTQQWYPALPGMVWLLVGFVAGDASRVSPSAD